MIIEGVVSEERTDIKEVVKEHSVKGKKQDDQLNFLNNKTAVMEDAVSSMETQFQHSVEDIRAALTKMEKLDDYLNALTNLNARTTELERLIMLAEGSLRSQHERMMKVENSKTENSEGKRHILDPRNLTVSVYGGTKNQSSSRRKALEVYMSRFNPEFDQILVFVRRLQMPVSEADFEKAARQACVDTSKLKWNFKQMSKDGGIYVKTKLGPDLTSTVSSVGEGFLNEYTQLNQKYEKMGKDTEGQMQESFAKLAGRQAKNLMETKMLVNKFEKQPREFYERTSKHLDKPLKR